MAQKTLRVQIGYEVIEQTIEVPDAEPVCEVKPEPKRRGRKPKANHDQPGESPSLDD